MDINKKGSGMELRTASDFNMHMTTNPNIVRQLSRIAANERPMSNLLADTMQNDNSITMHTHDLIQATPNG